MPFRSPQYFVVARVVWAAIDTAERAGLNTSRLYDGLPFDARSVRKLYRVDWADYCQIVERVEALVGGGEEFERFVETQYHESMPDLSRVAAAVVSPRLFYRFIFEVIDPLVFTALDHSYEDVAENRIRVAQWLRPGARPCLAYFKATVAALRGATSHLGMPPADGEFDLSPSHIVADLLLPPSRTITARLQRAVHSATRFILGYSPEGQVITATFGGDVGPNRGDVGPNRETLIAEVARTHDLTRRQTDVLSGIIDGRSNKEIAQSLGCSEGTVEKHMTILLGKLGVSSRTEVLSQLLKH